MAGEMNLYPALQHVVLTCTNVPLPEEDERAKGRELRFRPNLVATPQIRGELIRKHRLLTQLYQCGRRSRGTS